MGRHYCMQVTEEQAEAPEALVGPWELRSTMSGAERMWVEFGAEGELTCASSFGTGSDWGAKPLKRGQWQLRFVLLDKLKRPIAFEGAVKQGETHSLVMSGTISGARGTAQAASSVVGEFNGYKLE